MAFSDWLLGYMLVGILLGAKAIPRVSLEKCRSVDWDVSDTVIAWAWGVGVVLGAILCVTAWPVLMFLGYRWKLKERQ